MRFSPTAWAKLLLLRDAGSTEIGGFGLAADDDLLRVEDIVLVTQLCTATHVEFDDDSVADYFDAQVDAGRRPEEFARIWVHTHPGSSAEPSRTDEVTFARAFGGVDWAVMFILARGGQTFARLRYNLGPGVDHLLPVEVDYQRPFAGSDERQWLEEYERYVHAELPLPARVTNPRNLPPVTDDSFGDWHEAWDHYLDDNYEPNWETNYELDEF